MFPRLLLLLERLLLLGGSKRAATSLSDMAPSDLAISVTNALMHYDSTLYMGPPRPPHTISLSQQHYHYCKNYSSLLTTKLLTTNH